MFSRAAKLRHSYIAWGIIVGYEIAARDGELLSEAFDSWTVRHPWLSRLLIAYTAAHCANLLPQRGDVFAQATTCVQRAVAMIR